MLYFCTDTARDTIEVLDLGRMQLWKKRYKSQNLIQNGLEAFLEWYYPRLDKSWKLVINIFGK